MSVREAWTDERLDDLSRKMDLGFERLDKRIDQVDSSVRYLGARFDAMQRTLVGTSGVIVAALIGLIATQL